MIGEIELGGVFIPVALISGVAGFFASLILRRILRAVRAYAYIWHAGLFDVATFVVLWAVLDFFLGKIHGAGVSG